MAQQVPASAADFIDRGMMYMNGRKYAESIAYFTAALKLEPSNEWALADRALSHAWLQHYDEAQRDLAALDLRNAENVVGLRAHGIMAEFKDDCAKALGYYARALAKNASDTFTIGHKAICEANLSKSDEALADSATALKADPSWMDLRLLRANIFVDRGINDQVAKEADLITAENPRSTYAYVIAGRIYARLARTKDAMKAFDTALGIKPDALVYINRAQSRPFTDRTGRLADLDAALKLEPANPDALAEKAEQLAADGDVKAAKQLYDHLVELAGRTLLQDSTGSHVVQDRVGRRSCKAFHAITKRGEVRKRPQRLVLGQGDYVESSSNGALNECPRSAQTRAGQRGRLRTA